MLMGRGEKESRTSWVACICCDTRSERFYVFMIILGGLDWTGLLFICWILDCHAPNRLLAETFLLDIYCRPGIRP